MVADGGCERETTAASVLCLRLRGGAAKAHTAAAVCCSPAFTLQIAKSKQKCLKEIEIKKKAKA